MWISPYTSIFSYTNWSYILSFHCHFSPSSMAKFEYLLTFLSAMICVPCILMLEQRCKRKKKNPFKIFGNGMQNVFDIVSTCSMAIFLEWMFDSSFFFCLHLYVFILLLIFTKTNIPLSFSFMLCYFQCIWNVCVIVRVNFGWMNVSHSKSVIWNFKSQKNIIKTSRLWKISTIFRFFCFYVDDKIESII